MAEGLDRLETLRRESRFLFQGDRRPSPVGKIHPSSPHTSFDPEHPRGYWSPGTGLLLPVPLVRDVFASPLAAALMALIQSRSGARAFHVDEFPDGMVALTVGECEDNRGDYRRLQEALAKGVEPEPAFVNVLRRADFPSDRMAFPLPGVFVSSEPCEVVDRITLTRDDVRLLCGLLGPRIPCTDRSTTDASAFANPFTGVFARGGQLQFHPSSGKRAAVHRVPTDVDRATALERFKARGRTWLGRRLGEPMAVPDSQPALSAHALASKLQPIGSAAELVPHWSSLMALPTPRPPRGALARAKRFIEEHCTRALTLAEISKVARVGVTHLYSLFHSHLGCTPMAYAAKCRAEVAIGLLTSTRLSVGEVAARCGFSEQTGLTRSLKRHRGLTPAELRRSLKIQAEI